MPDPASVSKGLRDRIFALEPKDLGGLARPDGVLGAVMEFTTPKTWVSVVAIADGTTSLYFGSGGGVIGAGGKEAVRQANRRFLDAAGALVTGFSKVSSYPTPKPGAILFYVLTRDGVFSSNEVAEAGVRTPRNPMIRLYAAGQDIITQIRLSQEKR